MRLRKLVLILAAVLVAASLAACSSAGGPSEGQSSGGDQKQKEPQEQAEKQPEDNKMTEDAKDQQVAPEAGTGEDPASDRKLLDSSDEGGTRQTPHHSVQYRNRRIAAKGRNAVTHDHVASSA